MPTSFNYNKKNSYNDFGIIVRKQNTNLLPTKRSNPLTINGRNGSYYGNSGSVYNEMIISLECICVTKTYDDLHKMKREIALWLSKDSELELSDELGKFYKARIISEIPMEQITSLGRFTINFVCFPFAMSVPKQDEFIYKKKGQTMSINCDGTADTPCTIIIKNTGTKPITNIKITHKKEV